VFEYIEGILVEISPHKAIVEVNGIGYLLHIPLSSFSAAPPIGNRVLFYISSVIRENSYRNFAFLSREERDLFEKIREVSGMGPKIALSLIGHLDNNEIKMAIMTSDVALLSKIPGIGKRTAERLVIELRDKIFKQAEQTPLLSNKKIDKRDREVVDDALNALTNLGYKPLQAQQAINKALAHYEGLPPIEDLIKTALSRI